MSAHHDDRDELVTAWLREAAAQHEPDQERVRARVEAAMQRGLRQPAALTVLRPRFSRLRADLAVGTAAVGVAVVLVGVAVVVRPLGETAVSRSPDRSSGPFASPSVSGQGPTPASTPGSVPRPSGSVTSTMGPSGAAGASPPSSATREGPTSTGAGEGEPDRDGAGGVPQVPSTAVPSGDITGITSAAPVLPPGMVEVALSELPGRVTLPRSSADRDWVVVGSRSDQKAVRAKRGTGELTVPVVLVGGAAAVDAPVDVLWSGGAPEQDRDENGRWWRAPSAATTFRAGIGRVLRPGVLTLLLGAESVQAQVSVRVSGYPTPHTVQVPRGSGAPADGGRLVAVRLGEGAVGRQITVDVGSTSGAGTLAVAAVILTDVG